MPPGFLLFATVNTYDIEIGNAKSALALCKKSWEALSETDQKTAALLESGNKKDKGDIEAQFIHKFDALFS